jgi:recombinational DNA repair ATPase RecF
MADGVMAATHKLVQQAMQGHWHDVPKTLEQRRALLDQLSAAASPQDRQWLDALKQAMAESDAAVAKIAAVDVAQAAGGATGRIDASIAAGTTNGQIDTTLDMIRAAR